MASKSPAPRSFSVRRPFDRRKRRSSPTRPAKRTPVFVRDYNEQLHRVGADTIIAEHQHNPADRTRAIQDWLRHASIQHTVIYHLSPKRFKDFRRDR